MTDDQTTTDRPLAIVDIDGVIADVRHRLHFVEQAPKDWKSFFAAAPMDPVHPEGRQILERLAVDHDIVFLTGRPERCREPTVAWFRRHGIGEYDVIMRGDRERRSTPAYKVQAIRSLARDHRIGLVVDDDVDVIAAVESSGYPTFRAEWEQR